MTEDILYIIGPTAIGKSDYAIKLAQQYCTSIISADAYQVYKYMDIGTAKISKEQQQLVKHHLIDTHLPTEAYNVVSFLEQTKSIISNNRKQQKPTIICGGNGLYLKSFIHNYTFPKAKSDPTLRQTLESDYLNLGKQHMWEKLSAIDPISATSIHPNNKHHLLRALEIAYITNKAPSQQKIQRSARTDTKIIGLTSDRNRVISNINKRVSLMIKNGLIEEVNNLLAKGYDETLPSFNCIGYKEVIQFLKGRITSDKMIELINIHTSQFSKRQMTWFKKIQNVNWKTKI